jgi:hypothetical protein
VIIGSTKLRTFSYRSAECAGVSAGPFRAFAQRMHGIPKRFVYILRSDTDRSRHYVGITDCTMRGSNGITADHLVTR